MTLDDDRIGALAAVKLRGLLRGRASTESDPAPSGSRAVVRVDDRLWVYQPRSAESVLEAALLLATTRRVPRLAVVVDEVPETLPFALRGLHGVEAYRALGTELVAIEATVAPEAPAPPADHPLLSVLGSAGLDVVPDHEVWLGEIHGLEIARLGRGEHELQLGVGAFDRGAFEALYPDQSPIDALPRVIEQVRGHRHRGASPHLLNRLVRERWIRAEVCAQPHTVGLDLAVPIAGLTGRPGLHATVPDVASGAAGTERVLVVTGVGVDPTTVTVAAAVAVRERADRVVIVVPHRDRHDAIVGAARFVSTPTEVVGVDPPWE